MFLILREGFQNYTGDTDTQYLCPCRRDYSKHLSATYQIVPLLKAVFGVPKVAIRLGAINAVMLLESIGGLSHRKYGKTDSQIIQKTE
jgi:hypothetical protein